MDFTRCNIYKYEEGNNEELIKNQTIIKINGNDTIYRLYPQDKYGNKIKFFPEEKFKNLKFYLNFNEQNSIFIISNSKMRTTPKINM